MISKYHIPVYATAGRVCHTYRYLVAARHRTMVTDDFGQSVAARNDLVLFYIRGAQPSYQPEL